jgi:hypothetical protein
MPTLRQRKLAKKIVESMPLDNPPTNGEMLESVGYSKNVAEAKPGEIMSSPGVQKALEDLGFSIEGADQVVKNILYKSKREDMKLRAADMIYKRRGAYEDTKQGAGKTLVINVTQETAERYALTPRVTETGSEG